MTRSKEKFMEEKLIQELSTIPVERVQLVGRGHSSSNGTGTNTTTSTPPTSPTQTTVIPPEVVEMAAKRAGLIGQPLTSESVQELGRALKRWYVRHGYVLHALESARLRPETATAEIQVQEPVVSSVPVEIVFCRQLWVDPETGELLTQQQFKSKYRRRHQPTTSRRSRNNSQGGGSHTSKNRRSSSLSGPQQEQQQNETMSLATLMANANTTLVETSGRTRPSKIAKALRLKPGQPFQWDERRWKAVCQSGIFRQVLHVAPQWYRGGDDDNDDKNNGRTVQLQLIVLEDKPSHLQYGLGRSGYTGAWEGDLHVDWANVWGGGESIGFSLGRGRQDDEPSLRARWTNPQFGLHRGYEVEAFSESLGNKALDKYDNNNPSSSSTVVAGTTEPRTTPTTTKIASPPDYDHDALVHRRGLSFRVQNPLNMDQWLDKACTSWSLERTTTKTGLHENICSCTLFLGPVSRSLSLLTLLREEDAYANLDIKLTTGSRFQQQNQYPSSSLMIQSTTSPSRPAVVPSGGGEEEDAEPHSQQHQTEQQDEYKQEQEEDKQEQEEEEKEESHGQRRQSPFHLEQTLPSSSLLPTKLATRLPNIDLAFGPYAAASVTTRQTFPLVSTGTLTTDKRPVVLAFLHSVTASTLSLPRHEVRAQGIANTIRGCSSSATISHGRIATALRGTSELRIPIDIPKVPTQQDGKLVLFRDWLLATSSPTNDSISNRNNNVDPSSSSISYRQSCIGIGVRKSVQGIPLRFDVCCNHEGKIRSSIGFGRDFEAR